MEIIFRLGTMQPEGPNCFCFFFFISYKQRARLVSGRLVSARYLAFKMNSRSLQRLCDLSTSMANLDCFWTFVLTSRVACIGIRHPDAQKISYVMHKNTFSWWTLGLCAVDIGQFVEFNYFVCLFCTLFLISLFLFSVFFHIRRM